VFAMQESIARGNGLSREMTTATSNTRMWVERLRRDSLTWRVNDVAALNQTSYLRNVDAGWIQPIPGVGITGFVEAPGLDWSGAETLVAADQHFCTAIQLSWIRQGQTMRADVITWWSRRGRAPCADTSAALIASLANPASGFRQV